MKSLREDRNILLVKSIERINMEKLINLLNNKEKMKHFTIYIVFGVLATIVDFLTFYLLDKFVPILDENISNAIAIFVATVFAYVTNREYVFKSQESDKLKEFFKFFLGRMFSTVFNIVSFWIMTTFTTIDDLIIKAGISVVVVILNYIISKLFVFKEQKVSER